MIGIALDNVVFTFSQEGNCNGTTHMEDYGGYEELTITVESVTDSLTNDSGFLVLRSPTGWSINDAEDLSALLSYVTNCLKPQNTDKDNE